ncbi:copper homeostasis protein CutC [Flavobacteriaceae bacterium F89]|uniref:PF03932 family protein CutC n=1 Tax=Cerina litoralis TaxID=2874477 RepID=A0AAE3JP10_9FLAO|nr:copper homeostasis protein CutC [Cerina litoralis]MCG2460304.1 copper homeostasis protein CutC [Cerina litoralis]
MLVEVCANSLQSGLNAEKAGADRIELCSELGVGGITPSFGLLKSTREQLSLPVHVLIRPRSGDFTYSDLEFDTMKNDILLCVELGFAGVVSGVLNSDFTLDVDRTKELRQLARPLKFTFHRAFDWVKDPFAALAQLEEMGVDYILSSGQQRSALQGIKLLDQLHRTNPRCAIMPGGGIKEENAREFMKRGFKALHLTGTKFHKKLDKKPEVPMNSMRFLEEDEIAVSDVKNIQNVIKGVK